eukprot:5431454-Pleurochrysis_carterae.AAC.2
MASKLTHHSTSCQKYQKHVLDCICRENNVCLQRDLAVRCIVWHASHAMHPAKEAAVQRSLTLKPRKAFNAVPKLSVVSQTLLHASTVVPSSTYCAVGAELSDVTIVITRARMY